MGKKPLGDKAISEIKKVLKNAGKIGLTVMDITRRTSFSKPTVMKYLKELEKQNKVKIVKIGSYKLYKLKR